MEFKRHYYTLEQAAGLLEKYSIEDLNHFIETNQIDPVIFCKGRKFAAIRRLSNNSGWIAHGYCYYSGLLSAHKSWIKSLWEKGSITLNKAVIPLDRSNIRNWSTSNSYQQQSLSVGYNEWRPLRFDEVDISKLLLIPFAVEGASFLDMVDKLAESFSKPSGVMFEGQPALESKNKSWVSPLKDSERFTYSFEVNGKFTIDDLRLTSDLIERLSENNSTIKSGADKSNGREEAGELGLLPWSDSKKGGVSINEPLERLFRAHKFQAAKLCWRALREGHSKYDPDKVIEQVTNNEIHWFTRSDEQKVMKYKTFENRISEIKKFYKTNNVQLNE